MNEELFSIPEVKSPRLKWMERHGITVHHQPYDHGGPLDVDDQYAAIKGGKTVALGRSNEWALVNAAKKLGIKTWNEE